MSSILLTILVLLVLAVIILVARTTELLGILKGEGETTDEGNQTNGILLLIFMILFLGAATWSLFYFAPTNLPVSASEHGKVIDNMFFWTSVICGIVFVITQILLFYFAFKYRSRKGHSAMFFSHDNKLEIIWTVIPAIVLTVLVAYGIETWYMVTSAAPKDARIIEVTGEQFMWNIRYPGKDGKLGEREYQRISGDNSLGIVWEDSASHDDLMPTEIHLEVNKPVLFKLGAKDVLHSFFLPHFRVKMDCVPGIPTQFWFTPTITTDSMRIITGNSKFEYELACSELCGSSHWNMRRVVTVETADKYNKWISSLTPVYDPATMGKTAPAQVKTAETKEGAAGGEEGNK